MRFWDREKEVKDLKAHIESEPNSILFVYGPKSSGKSTLLKYVAEILTQENRNKYLFMWNDLRQRVLSDAQDVLKLFFRKKGWLKNMMEMIGSIVKFNPYNIEVDPSKLVEILNGEIDPFEEMIRHIGKKASEGKKVTIVFDELQNLKDIYINGDRKFIDRLFNFFVAITKVEHLSHVIVMTSDTFFIEEVYTSSSLKNTSIYYLVDYFDDDTAKKILIEEGLSKDDAEYVVDMAGGVPWVMAEVTSNGDPKEKLMEIYDQIKSRLFGYIENKMINGEDEKITYRVLEKILKGLYPKTPEELREVRKLVQAEVLFYEPIKRKIKFQTKLDERAARELLKE